MKRLLLVLLVACAAAGCAGSARTDKLEATWRAYERAVRWSDFPTAFALAGQPQSAPPDLRYLRDIRVVAYEKVGPPRAENDGAKVSQAVEIRYVNVNHMSERILADRQVWEYQDATERWTLTSPFPSFK